MATTLFEREYANCQEVRTPRTLANVFRHTIWNVAPIGTGAWSALWRRSGTAMFDFFSHLERELRIPGYAGECLAQVLGLDGLLAIRDSTAYRLGRAITAIRRW